MKWFFITRQKKNKKKNVISAHLARNNSTYWTANQSIGHIRNHIQGKIIYIFYNVDAACTIYLYLVLRR